MKEKIFKNTICGMVFFGLILGFSYFSFAQSEPPATKITPSTSDDVLKKSVQEAIKKAVKDIEDEKAVQEQALAKELEDKLVAIINKWIIEARADKSEQLNKLQHRDWSELKRFVSPLPHDYYLRGFAYVIIDSDVEKTNSVIAPYKAYVAIEERLFVERYHSSDASDIVQYLYTVFTPISLHLEYRDNEFIISEIEYGQITIENSWLK